MAPPDQPDPVAVPADDRRLGRQPTLTDLLGRLAGAEAMKGASPIDRQRQARTVVGLHLRQQIDDPDGALRTVLEREIGDDPRLAQDPDHPFAAALACLDRILGSDAQLADFVRHVDMEWGRTMDERPHFDSPGQATDPDDPYTIASVRRQLVDYRSSLPSDRHDDAR